MCKCQVRVCVRGGGEGDNLYILHMCVSVCVRACVFVSIYIHTHIYVYVYYTHVLTHTHTLHIAQNDTPFQGSACRPAPRALLYLHRERERERVCVYPCRNSLAPVCLCDFVCVIDTQAGAHTQTLGVMV
jgi:hypothetical protein